MLNGAEAYQQGRAVRVAQILHVSAADVVCRWGNLKACLVNVPRSGILRGFFDPAAVSATRKTTSSTLVVTEFAS